MIGNEIVTAREVDLSNCDREAIHIPGSIQPHGVLLALSEPELTVLQVSNNTLEFFGIAPEQLINKPLSRLLYKSQIASLRECLTYKDIQAANPIKISVHTDIKLKFFDGILHRSDGILILELEPATLEEDIRSFGFYHGLKAASYTLKKTSDFNTLCQAIAKEVRNITGFHRVMVYKFDSEGNGAVIAEDRPKELPSFLGLNYPATDIPKQARELYFLNWVRLIVDVDYQPVEIIPLNNSVTNRSIDQTHSVLRSVSPIHVEYLKNMGVSASMSISIIKDKKLWGLVACHHYSPKYVPYEVRTACQFLGQIVSLELSYKETSDDYDYQLKLKSLQSKFIEYMSGEESFDEGLVKYYPNILDLVSASGAAVCLGEKCTLIGKTPELTDIDRLIKWLANFDREVFYTESLAKLYPEAEKYKDEASGLIAILISQAQNHYILWFRPEVIQTVNWAGEPNKAVEIAEDGSIRLSPRKSFDLWKETVRLKCLPWKQCEIDAAIELRRSIVSIVLRQIDKLIKLNAALQESSARERSKAEQLEIALKELQQAQTHLVQSEKMSSLGQMVAGLAHEINNPINFIYGNLVHADDYTQDLLHILNLYQQHFPSPGEEIAKKIEEFELDFLVEDLPKLLGSMRVGADRIREIIKALRIFSRIDESEMKPVNIHEGIDSTLLILSNRLKPSTIRPGIKVVKDYGKLPDIYCYAGQLNQVFMNILSNAIDALEEQRSEVLREIDRSPIIKIRTYVADRNRVVILIADNGPGISSEVQHRLFEEFFTTKSVGKGTGIGLAISYSVVVEKHGGRLTCVSAPGQGAEFAIEIPIDPRLC